MEHIEESEQEEKQETPRCGMSGEVFKPGQHVLEVTEVMVGQNDALLPTKGNLLFKDWDELVRFATQQEENIIFKQRIV